MFIRPSVGDLVLVCMLLDILFRFVCYKFLTKRYQAFRIFSRMSVDQVLKNIRFTFVMNRFLNLYLNQIYEQKALKLSQLLCWET